MWTMSSSVPPRTGTQNIERVALLLRELATRGIAGWGLRDLATHCELDRATVHRILQALVRERLAHQSKSDRRYRLGPLAFELGASLPRHTELVDGTRCAVRQLVTSTKALVSVAFLRSGDDCVCIARAGATSYTSEATAIRPGHRAPMLGLSGGVAILGALTRQEALPIVTRNRARLSHLGVVHLARLEALLRRSERMGWVISQGQVWRGIYSVAVAFGELQAPVGSLVVSGAEGDFSAPAMRRIANEAQAAAAALSARCPAPG
jgi:DNA-binding IclR family transcriptional regulator